MKVILGVNNTVVWTNADSEAHRLFWNPNFPNPFEFQDVFLYPGESFQYVFVQAGSFYYRGVIIHVIPNDALNAYLDISIDGLKDSYKLDQDDPIEFSVDMSGFETGCGDAKMFVDTIDADQDSWPHPWSAAGFYDCFNVAVPYKNVSYHFPEPYQGHAYRWPIDEPGHYRLEVSFLAVNTNTTYSITREFLMIR